MGGEVSGGAEGMSMDRVSSAASDLTSRAKAALALGCIALVLTATACRDAPPPAAPPAVAPAPRPSPTAVFPDGTALRLDLAVTPEEQERGLMFVEDLPNDRGMLFLYGTDDIRPFWMKNCKISMDFIWLAEDGTVVDITRDAPPCPGDPCPTYQASAPSRYNLEVRGGLAAEHGLRAGDRVRLQNLPPP